MKFTKEDIEIGNRLITDFMGVSIVDASDESTSWFKGNCWSPYKDSGWNCASSNKEELLSYFIIFISRIFRIFLFGA